VLLLVTLGAVALYLASRPSRVSAPDELEPLMRDLCLALPFHLRFIEKQGGTALRSGRGMWVPNRLYLHARSEADRISKTRMKAHWKLKHMETNAWPAIPALLSALNHATFEVRWAAANVLAGIKADGAPEFRRNLELLKNQSRPADALVWILLHKNEFGQAYDTRAKGVALGMLAACGSGAKSAIPALQGLARNTDEDHELRALAVAALGNLGPEASLDRELLRRLLQNREEWPDVRGAAAFSLARVAPKAGATRSLLHQALNDRAAMVRVKAAAGLWRLGVSPDDLLPVLVPALDHNLASVRRAALAALGEMGVAARSATSAVEVRMKDPKIEVRDQAAATLRQIRAEMR
jgi:HEAT repeat protein